MPGDPAKLKRTASGELAGEESDNLAKATLKTLAAAERKRSDNVGDRSGGRRITTFERPLHSISARCKCSAGDDNHRKMTSEWQ